MYKKNYLLPKKSILIAGIDEVGCGSLVGSVVAAAVVLVYPTQIPFFFRLADSKILNNNKRLRLYEKIKKYSINWSIGVSDVSEIDRLNILQARLLAMKRAIYNLSIIPDLILIDGNQSPIFKNIFYQCFVKGDSIIPIISAASIVAKVIRDQYMIALNTRYPQYGFDKNKGYPTSFHLNQLYLYGPTKYHRKTFVPVKYIINDYNN